MTSKAVSSPYPVVDPQASFPLLEEKVLEFWKRERIFEASIENRPAGEKGSNEYVFYDGPPFANGLPHHGHLLTGFVKDVIPRFQTMRGKRVERRFGWDCHGLPAEMEAEKQLKISGRQQITEFGIEKFNSYCRQSVLKYSSDWEQYVTRQARWVDFKNDYKTMNLDYMESVVWAFKRLWDKGLIYEGYRVMPYSWACETPLSNFEIRLDNATRPRQDPAVTVLFTLTPQAGENFELKLLVWTTTPWTLPSNLGIAIGPEIDYAIMEENGVRYVIGESVLAKYEAQLKGTTKVGSLKGKDLVGRRYTPLFPYFKNTSNAFQVMGGEFVDTTEGTGIVHMAPGFGEEDQKLCERHGISIVCPVDNQGKFTEEVPEWKGVQVFDANKDIIRVLKDRKVLIKHETYMHNYPHCWRTDTPIIYRAISSWYVRVTDFKDRMIELNQNINWIPGHIKNGQFGKWLEGARDWSISRTRFWGAPIPVWKSDDPKYPRMDVYGSLDEIQRDFGVRPTDLHRPFIDSLTRPNPDDPTGKSTMRRVEEVLDCWFESGSMPFAQVHYPFENREWFENHSPADFIVEYAPQTRGWFYLLVVLGTALFDKHPFKNCMCHGIVVDEEGQKVSKRKANYVPVEDVFRLYGADACRWLMMSSPILKGEELEIDKEGKAFAEVIRSVINPIWNAWYFFSLYANSDGVKGRYITSSTDLLDQYILAKTRTLVEQVTQSLETYEIALACQYISAFIDALNNWYIRRSRERFWKHEKDADKQNAYDTLYTVLNVLCRVIAPLLPNISEIIYQGLEGQSTLSKEYSVHLKNWPKPEELPQNDALVEIMDGVRDVCSSALALREKHQLRTRLPLRSLTVAGPETARFAEYSSIIRDELNVKEVKFSDKVEDFASFNLQLNARELGPRLGESMKAVLAAARAGQWKRLPSGVVEVAGQQLQPGDYTLRVVPREGLAGEALSRTNAVAILDIKLDDELQQEGTARDLVRLVQQARKEADLHISDHIALYLELPSDLQVIVSKYQAYLAEQTLADVVEWKAPAEKIFSQEVQLDNKTVRLSLSARKLN